MRATLQERVINLPGLFSKMLKTKALKLYQETVEDVDRLSLPDKKMILERCGTEVIPEVVETVSRIDPYFQRDFVGETHSRIMKDSLANSLQLQAARSINPVVEQIEVRDSDDNFVGYEHRTVDYKFSDRDKVSSADLLRISQEVTERVIRDRYSDFFDLIQN